MAGNSRDPEVLALCPSRVTACRTSWFTSRWEAVPSLAATAQCAGSVILPFQEHHVCSFGPGRFTPQMWCWLLVPVEWAEHVPHHAHPWESIGLPQVGPLGITWLHTPVCSFWFCRRHVVSVVRRKPPGGRVLSHPATAREWSCFLVLLLFWLKPFGGACRDAARVGFQFLTARGGTVSCLFATRVSSPVTQCLVSPARGLLGVFLV